MCGIFGVWHTDGQPVALAAVRNAVTSLRHRGPGDEGYLLANTRAGRAVLCAGDDTTAELNLPHIDDISRSGGEQFNLALGFRRLAIVDLSPAGHQPMCSLEEDLWLVFNGEIYNHIELRAELKSLGYHFRTRTDTEVILAAYRHWGRDCVDRFNGMWAFALWDMAHRTLFVSRDRIGVKPLYTAWSNDRTFAFASEIKGLLAAKVVSFSPSTRAVGRYIAFGRLPSHQEGETFLDGVHEFPAAHSAVVGDKRQSRQRFWSIPDRRSQPATSIQEVCGHYKELFHDAVRLRLRSDVPVGTCLSGGLDSSSIVASIAQIMASAQVTTLESLGQSQHTFSAAYPIDGRWNETEHIRRVVRHTGATSHCVRPTADDLWGSLDQLVWHQDEPFQSTSIFAQWCVMGLARRADVTVLLDGQGADELLGGYAPFGVVLADLITRARIITALREARQIHSVTGLTPIGQVVHGLVGHLPRVARVTLSDARMQKSFKSSGLRRDLIADVRRSIRREGGAYRELHSLRNLDEHLEYLMLEHLPDLLRHEDRNSMAFSIEGRVPFLDYRLVEYVFTRGADLRIVGGWTEWLQRMSVADVLPDDIVWRRDKVGFETPEVEWFQTSQAHLLDLLSSSDGEEYLDLDYVRRQVPHLLHDVRGTRKVWRWINLVVWLRLFRDSQNGTGPHAP